MSRRVSISVYSTRRHSSFRPTALDIHELGAVESVWCIDGLHGTEITYTLQAINKSKNVYVVRIHSEMAVRYEFINITEV
jgi:putative NIF3 family GTP cyclohydrolase 1 type 2